MRARVKPVPAGLASVTGGRARGLIGSMQHRTIAEIAVMRRKSRKIRIHRSAAGKRLVLCLVGRVSRADLAQNIAVQERTAHRAQRHDDEHAPHHEVVGGHGDLPRGSEGRELSDIGFKAGKARRPAA